MSKSKTSGIFNNLLPALFLTFIGIIVLTSTVDDVFGDIDPTKGIARSKIGKLILLTFIEWQGTLVGYLVSLVFLAGAGYYFYNTFRIVKRKEN